MHQLFRISLLPTPIKRVCQLASVPQPRLKREFAEVIKIAFCRFIVQVPLQRVIELESFIGQIVWRQRNQAIDGSQRFIGFLHQNVDLRQGFEDLQILGMCLRIHFKACNEIIKPSFTLSNESKLGQRTGLDFLKTSR